MQHETSDPARDAADLPVIAADRVTLELWVRALNRAADAVREIRQRSGWQAWSPAEDAAREHDLQERSAAPPPVRPLTPEERDRWRDLSDTADIRAVSDVRTRHELRVQSAVVGDRWILDAEVQRPSFGDSPENISQVTVSCATAALAQQCADELVAAGPDPRLLLQLASQATARAERHAAAVNTVRESPTARLARTHQAIHQQWRPELAHRVTSSPAFGAFAERLRQLEDRGVAIPTVLGQLNQDELVRPQVRDAAALAEWMCEGMLSRVAGTPQDAHGASPRLRPSPVPRPSPQPTSSDRSPAASAAEPTPTPPSVEKRLSPAAMIAQGFSKDLASRILDCPAWPALARRLAHSDSPETVVDQLRQMSARQIATARKPAAYTVELLRQAQASQRGKPYLRPRRSTSAFTPDSGVDKATLDDLSAATYRRPASRTPENAHGQRAARHEHSVALSPMHQAQLILAASSVIKKGYLSPQATGLENLPGAATPQWVSDILKSRRVVRSDPSGPARRFPRTPFGDIDLAATLGLPSQSLLYAAAAIVATEQPVLPGHPVLITSATLAKRIAGTEADRIEELLANLERHVVVSPKDTSRSYSPLASSDQLPDLLQRLENDLAPGGMASDSIAAADRHSVIHQLEVADDAERHAASDRATDPDHEGHEFADSHQNDHARLDDNLAAAARAEAAEKTGSAAAAALRGAVTCTPTQTRATTAATKTPSAATKSPPSLERTLRQDRRR